MPQQDAEASRSSQHPPCRYCRRNARTGRPRIPGRNNHRPHSQAKTPHRRAPQWTSPSRHARSAIRHPPRCPPRRRARAAVRAPPTTSAECAGRVRPVPRPRALRHRAPGTAQDDASSRRPAGCALRFPKQFALDHRHTQAHDGPPSRIGSGVLTPLEASSQQQMVRSAGVVPSIASRCANAGSNFIAKAVPANLSASTLPATR